jgi:hypothetical protein
MKTLKNHTLLYDEDCPLCQVYTSGFIKTGMLDQDGRQAFSQISIEEQNFINLSRASNEIALVDRQNKTVIYGVDSLLKVIGFRFPIIQKIGQFQPIKFLLQKLYSLVSYNRKVIIPSKDNSSQQLQCIPKFNITYRLLYILFALIVTLLSVFIFFKNIPILPDGSLLREGIITVGQLVFQGMIIYTLDKKTILNYFGNMMTVSLMGSLMLITLMFINWMIPISEPILTFGFGIIISFMFTEHFRRVKLLELPIYLSYTWAIYSVLILIIILITN